jgi:hypothetical protein
MQKLIDTYKLVRDYLYSFEPATMFAVGLGMLTLALAIVIFL